MLFEKGDLLKSLCDIKCSGRHISSEGTIYKVLCIEEKTNAALLSPKNLNFSFTVPANYLSLFFVAVGEGFNVS